MGHNSMFLIQKARNSVLAEGMVQNRSISFDVPRDNADVRKSVSILPYQSKDVTGQMIHFLIRRVAKFNRDVFWFLKVLVLGVPAVMLFQEQKIFRLVPVVLSQADIWILVSMGQKG